MATPVIMPRQGQSVESCIITKWHKHKGDAVAVGDILFSYETDKAAFDEEATVAGTLLETFFEEGDDVECLLNVCVIGNEGEDVSQFRPQGAATEEAAAPAAEVKKDEPSAPVAVAEPAAKDEAAEGFVKISPRAKALAQKQSLDYRYAVPTGPDGRIIERDVRALAESGIGATPAAMNGYLGLDAKVDGTGIGGRVRVSDLAAPVAPAQAAQTAASDVPEFVEEKLPNIRKVIAKSMHKSLSEMAQLTLNTSFDATEISAFRAKVKENKDALGFANITLNDIILFAVAKTLPAFRELNAHFYDDKMVFFNHVNLGIAVDTPRGLMVPTVFKAETLSLNDLSKAAKAVITDAQNGSINPDLLTGGSFTVTNLGAMGIESFTPVINPPQTGILGVDTITTKVKVVNGQLVPYKAMGLSLTFDHRALDGAPAAKFLQALCKNLENFSLLLAK